MTVPGQECPFWQRLKRVRFLDSGPSGYRAKLARRAKLDPLNPDTGTPDDVVN